MQCNCGGEAPYCEHKVKTLEKAQEWYADITDVPVFIRRYVCEGCGRQMMLPSKQVNPPAETQDTERRNGIPRIGFE